ncbi:hypothetical protein BC962_2413 [Gillisia mitskevichiae]|uniref:Fimbrillin-A associated anchor protein Mfa1/Mfa2 n=1 Tax=Gillisia mitskevichiae TaxID=270921 RepID=A0A495PIT6_9FLAO|nr:hypothetical protein [Gillisia mitskevichiae]RKS50641.1 hypothetical protein BC962_2413 [Gillisia mitskevichiae]
MKKFNYYLSFIAILALIFTSCSKEESDIAGLDGQDTFQLQFGTLLNDFDQSKDHLSDDPVECSDAAPSYVLVALTNSDDEWVGGMNPEADGADASDFIRVNLKNNNGSWETEYSDVLGLPAGTYQLQYFIVYSADDEVLWVAPREGGAYAGSVVDPLPQEIMLGAGTKPYVEVDVLCYVPRMEEAYGYIFFDLNLIRITNNYCIFVNYCDDETGREYPAKFMVEVWADGYDGSEIVINGEMNSISQSGDYPAASVLCFPLPPLQGDDTYFVRVTVMDDALLPYTSDASDVVQFQINQSDIDAQLTETPRYEHLKINCNPNQEEPYCTPSTANVSSCNFYCDGGVYGFLSEEGDMGAAGFVHITNANISDTFKLYVEGTTNPIADVNLDFSGGGDLRVHFSNLGNNLISAFEIDARLPNGSSADICNDTRCNDDCVHNDNFTERLEGDVISPQVLASGGFFLKVRVQEGFCPSL